MIQTLMHHEKIIILFNHTANSTCGGGGIHPQWDTMLRDLNDPNLPWLGFLVGALPGITWYICADQVCR